ncbi:serine/threonine protein kinase [Streptomyces sp. RS10V-4]|nr:serine/threonine-protein kinase [Streptomyces rhizoryzae]MCK7624681.1 serine/threonine protein kinase [Streptomyces rhizoryzae]
MVNGAEPSGIFQPLAGDDPRVIAGYRLTAKLGAGGMGKVYLSYTPGGRPVAIKVIRPEFSEDTEFRRRFAQEVQAAQRVQGLFTAPVIDSDTEGPVPWLATAYVPGPALSAAVAEHGPLPVPTVLLLVAGIAEALQVIHGAGIVHRDLKPSNVLLAADGPRVIDFGIARAADATALTGSGVTVGTPAFMAPEQATGATVTAATDVFALGQVAAYAAGGSPVFGEGTSHGVLYRIVHEEPDLSGLPDALRDLIGRCLAKEASARPTVAEVIALCGAASGETQLRRPEEWLPAAVAADITTRAAAPAPRPTPPPPLEAPAAGVPARPAQPPAAPPVAPVPTALDTPRTPPPGFGPPAYGAAAAHPAPPAAPPAAPGVPAPPAPAATAPFPAPQPPGKKRKGPLAALVAVCALALVGVGGGAVYFLMPDHRKAAAGSEAPGGRAKATGTPAPAATPGTGGTGRPTPETPRQDPAPADTKGIDLPFSYRLAMSDDPITPKALDGGGDVALDGSDLAGGRLTTRNGSTLVLLKTGQQGSLDTCRHDTRYTDTIPLPLLGKGSQICLTTSSGTVALLSYRGASGESEPSRYITLDVRVWRGAQGPGSTS